LWYPAWLPDIAVRGKNLHVIYSSWLNGYGRDEVYFLHSPNGGSSWKPAVRLTNNETDSTNPAIAVNETNVFASSEDDVTLSREIYVASAPLKNPAGGPPLSPTL